MMTHHKLKIGELAQKSGVAVGALRYYESLNLLQSERGANGYRYYEPSAIQQIQFIKKAQALGLSLEDIQEILNIHHQGDLPCHFVRSRIQAKIDQLSYQIQEMNRFKATLETYRDRWNEEDSAPKATDICPLIESIPLDTTA